MCSFGDDRALSVLVTTELGAPALREAMPTSTRRLMVAKVSGNLAAILQLRSIKQKKGEEDELVGSTFLET